MSDVGGGGFSPAVRMDFAPEPEPAAPGANWGAAVAAMLQARPGSPLAGPGQADGQPDGQAAGQPGAPGAGNAVAGGDRTLPAALQSVPLPPVVRASEAGGPVGIGRGEPGAGAAAAQMLADPGQATRLPAATALPPVQPGAQTAGLSPAMQTMLANAGYARPSAPPAPATSSSAALATSSSAAPATSSSPAPAPTASPAVPAQSPAAPAQAAAMPAASVASPAAPLAHGPAAPALPVQAVPAQALPTQTMPAAAMAPMPAATMAPPPASATAPPPASTIAPPPATPVQAPAQLPGQAALAEQPRPQATAQAHSHAPQSQPAAAPQAQAASALMPQVTPLSTIAAPLLAAPGLAPLLDNLPPLQRTRPQRGPALRRSPQRAHPELWMSDIIASLPDRTAIVYTDNRPLKLDLFPARARTACWRLDDTQALVEAGADQRADSRRAAGLHAMLVGGAPNLAALRVGEGFSTWLGSPLWLHLAGIAKPAEMGVLLAESAPARLEVVRTGVSSWRVAREPGHGVRHAANLEGAALEAALYGWAPGPQDGARLVLRTAGHLAPPHGVRVQEAWAAVLRAENPPAAAPAWRLAPDGDLRGAMAALRPRGEDVLQRVLDGVVHDLDRLDGIALAMVLGRLTTTLNIGDHG